MPTSTATFAFQLPVVGADIDTWGGFLNTNFQSIEDLLDGSAATRITPDLGTGWEIQGVAVTATAADLNKTATGFLVPTGGIILWSGSIASIPSGWALCDGTSGTPDLRDRFVVGAGTTYAVGATGGANTVTLAEANLPAHDHAAGTLAAASGGAHTHTGTTASSGAHTHTYNIGTGAGTGTGASTLTATGVTLSTNSDGAHTHTFTTASGGAHTHSITGNTANAGSGTAHENRPPYYALAYIMKL